MAEKDYPKFSLSQAAALLDVPQEAVSAVVRGRQMETKPSPHNAMARLLTEHQVDILRRAFYGDGVRGGAA